MKKLLIILFFPGICSAAGTVQFQSNGTGGGSVTIAGAAVGSGGGSSSSLSVGTGTASNYTTQITSPTSSLSFNGNQFHSIANGTTNFMTIYSVDSSVLPSTVVYSNTNQTITGLKTFSSDLIATAGESLSAAGLTPLNVSETSISLGEQQTVAYLSGITTNDSLFPSTELEFYHQRSGGAVADSRIGLRDKPGEDKKFIISGSSTASDGNYTDYTDVPYPLVINVSTNSASYGFVGIGISTPTSALQVNGNGGITISSNGFSGNILYSSSTSKLIVSTATEFDGTVYVVTTSTLSSIINNGLIVQGHIEISSTTPTAPSCGTGASFSVGSNDQQGTITVGGGVVTSCPIVFAVPWNNAPACNVLSGAAIASLTGTSTTTTFTFSGTSLTGDVVMYQCMGGR